MRGSWGQKGPLPQAEHLPAPPQNSLWGQSSLGVEGELEVPYTHTPFQRESKPLAQEQRCEAHVCPKVRGNLAPHIGSRGRAETWVPSTRGLVWEVFGP